MCLNIALNGMNTEQQCDNVNVGVNLMLTSFFVCFWWNSHVALHVSEF